MTNGSEAELAEAYFNLFDESVADALEVLNDLAANFSFQNQPIYDPSEPNAATNAIYREGQQSVLRHVLLNINKHRRRLGISVIGPDNIPGDDDDD